MSQGQDLRCGSSRAKLVNHIEGVLVETRDNIYITDKQFSRSKSLPLEQQKIAGILATRHREDFR
jgi:hypothetical protein